MAKKISGLQSQNEKSARAGAKKKQKYVYYFGDGQADGGGKMKPLLGGKGANLAEMTRIGLPVPPGFTITTEVCTYYYEHKRTYPRELEAEVAAALAKVENSVNKKLGDRERPLLVSVRSGARDSMPGMMDTILNLGMNDEVVEIVAKKSGNARFSWDSYRRFLQMYGDVVMGVQKLPNEDHEPFESVIEHLKDERYGNHNFPDVQLTVDDLKTLVQRFKDLIKERTKNHFRRILTRNCGARSARFSVPGIMTVPSFIAANMESRTNGARPSTCRRWFSETWETRARPASLSRAIRRAARKFSTANI